MQELDRSAAAALLPRRDEGAAKWAFGRALLCCGSAGMPGAAALSARAALRSGAGLCVLASVPAALAALPVCAPECVLCPLPEGSTGAVAESGLPVLLREGARADGLLFGCGVGISDDGRALLRGLLAGYGGTLVLDADGLNLLAEEPSLLRTAAGRVLLTPHRRELARLCGTKEAGPAEAAAFAAKYGVTVLCKGGGGTVAGPEGPLCRLEAPNSGMAKGGSGDVLAGLAVGLLAQGMAPAEGAALALWLHARAGALARADLGARAMLPTDVIAHIGAAFREMERD